MGAGQSHANDEQDRPPVFVVPAHLDLTPRQLSMMIETGHQPGVPFPVVTQEAVAEQPPRLRTTFFHSQCHIHKDTVEVYMAGNDEALVVDFTFDTSAECQMSMYLFSKEPSTEDPKFEDDALVFQAQWPAGMKQKFVGEEHPQSFIDWARVEERHCNGEDPDVSTVDLLMVLEPIANAEDMAFKMVDAEITSVRLVVSEFEDSYAINKLVTQKVKTPLGFFHVQELFGIDADNNVHTTPAETGDTSVADSGGGQLDQIETNAECVICLTNPRDIALLPCRHTCLCATCAAALTSQQNKCPICRRRAEMCLHLIPVHPEGQV